MSFTENTFGSGFERKMSKHRTPKVVIALEFAVYMNFYKFPSKEILLNRKENTTLSSVVKNRIDIYVDKFSGETDLKIPPEFYGFCGRLLLTEILILVWLLQLSKCLSFQYTLDIDLDLSWGLHLFVDISVFVKLLTCLMPWEPSNRSN